MSINAPSSNNYIPYQPRLALVPASACSNVGSLVLASAHSLLYRHSLPGSEERVAASPVWYSRARSTLGSHHTEPGTSERVGP
eukprot:3895838-Rhodomonas_salina.1